MPSTGGLTNPRPWRGRCRAGYSNTGGPPWPQKRAPLQKSLCREATYTTPIFENPNEDSCKSIITATFNKKHPLHQRQRQFFNLQQSLSQNALKARENLLILMKEADVDSIGQEDIACIMMLNCFIDSSLKAKLDAVKSPNLQTFNDIVKSHEAGKRRQL